MKLSLSAAAAGPPVVKRREGRASRGASEAEDEFSIFWLMVEDEAELSAAVAGAPGGEVYL